MKKFYIEIPEESWGIVFCYDFDESDLSEIRAICKGFWMKTRNIERSLNVLSTFNSGMTVSSDDLRMSAIFIGNATSKSQWLNTVVHETAHTAAAIVDYYKRPCNGEDIAYLQGYIFQRIIAEVADIK